jgi:murein L,D-transpeptidase YcbB/YkuD
VKTYFLYLFRINLLLCITAYQTTAQIQQEIFQRFIYDNPEQSKVGQKNREDLFAFYTALNFKWAWLKSADSTRRNDFLQELKNSTNLGLQESDYQASYIESIFTKKILLQTVEDSLVADLRITSTAIRFYRDIFYGTIPPVFGYDGLEYKPDCDYVVSSLADYLQQNKLQYLVSKISPSYPEVIPIINMMKWLSKILNDVNYREEKIVSSAVSTTNKPLVLKLFQLGIIDDINSTVSDKTIKLKLQQAQRLLNLLDDGTLRSTSIQQLNVPITTRFTQLTFSLNYFRWLQCVSGNQAVIVVNIPAAYLKVYKDYNIIFETRLIVGKKSTPTPTLTSRINEVILYPYWHVPNSIATKELLPAIKKNTDFLDAGNYQVLNKAGKILDPYTINWSNYSRQNFPFIIRQSTGCDNALGLLKLNFYNPAGVYLHDTPSKFLFMSGKRFFSHGCMRMENPFELGRMILRNNTEAIDTLEQKGCVRNQSPVTVAAVDKMPVIVWYNPAGVDSLGRVIFYKDVYSKFNWMK